MTVMDLFNEHSVRLAEATRIKLYLPGLGKGGLPEDEEDPKQKGGSTGPASAWHAYITACYIDQCSFVGVRIIYVDTAITLSNVIRFVCISLCTRYC